MKIQIAKIEEAELVKIFPIKGKAVGWFYKLTETSNGAWKIEGSDLWGRKIGITGSDEKELVESAEAEAMKLNDNIRAS